MPRIFEKRNSYGIMSEQEDIDSDFPQSDDNSMISVEFHDDSDDDDEDYIIEEETYYSSDNNSRRIETQVYDRTESSDEDSIEYYSDSESYCTEDEIIPNKSYEDSDVTSPTSVSEDVDGSSKSKKSNKKSRDGSNKSKDKKARDGSSKSKKSKKKDKKDKKKNKKGKEKKGGFLNKLINSKILTSLKDVTSSGRRVIENSSHKKKRNSDLSEGDIERSESGYGTSGKGSYPQDESMDSYYDVSTSEGSHSRSMSQSYSMSTQSYSRSHDVSESETSTSQNSSLLMSPQPRKSLNEDRRKAYEQALPDVAEEIEEDFIENTEKFEPEYRTYRVKMEKGMDPAMHSYESFKKKSSGDSKESNTKESNTKRDAPVRDPPDAPEETPDPISPTRSTSKKSKAISHSPKSTKTSKSKKKKKKDKSKHSAALSGRTHSVSSRLNYAGQICSSPMQTKKKTMQSKKKEENESLEGEVHRLRTLVELMMTRMELYERQSECLVETSLEHDREWKKTTIEHFEAAQKRKVQSESGKQLTDIKNLLTERSIQDKWIRQLESVQRGYQNRLATTQNQLRALRYEHILTNKQIVDFKKNGGDLAISNHTPDTLLEDLTTSTKNGNIMAEATTPVMANLNVTLPKWVDPSSSGRDASGKKVLLDGTSQTTLATSQGMEPRGRKGTTSLLEEMIVSWHNDDTDISVLSEKGRNKDKRKLAKKAKKKKKKEDEKKKQQRRDSNSSAPEIDGRGGFVSVQA